MTKQTRTLEIRAAEGGEDSRIFVAELANAYLALGARYGWKARMSHTPNVRSGNQQIDLEFTGEKVELLDKEGGNVRIQRIPPTEQRGRVHTSTVTVAVLGLFQADLTRFTQRKKDDFELEWFHGTIGAGGQHHQKHACAVKLKHKPTGIIQTAQTRSRQNSLALATSAMNRILDEAMEKEAGGHSNALRKKQIGNGQRAGEKRRTFRFQDDRVLDHITGLSARCSDVMRGKLDILWKEKSISRQ